MKINHGSPHNHRCHSTYEPVTNILRSWLLGPEHDDRISKVNLVVAQEDIDILEELDPVRTPESPGRRTSKNCVMKTVPLLPGR